MELGVAVLSRANGRSAELWVLSRAMGAQQSYGRSAELWALSRAMGAQQSYGCSAEPMGPVRAMCIAGVAGSKARRS